MDRSTLYALILVASGGALGSAGRYLLSGLVMQHTMGWRFPLGTFIVNVLGCLVIGVLAGCVMKNNLFSTEARLFLFTGIAGGFTTFSAFGLESFYLLRRSEFLMAGGYILLSVTVCLLALWLGFSAVPRQG
ncbi:MAG: fluoride efflux transporter CrcB [Desulfobulbus sp.]|nr:fluoride efflux transporter CrcB [Desulfobulbus sp.]